MAISRKLITALKTQLAAHANPKDAAQMQAYMKTETLFYGVRSPALKAIQKQTFPLFLLTSFDDWRDTILSLWRGANYREEKHCAIALCNSPLYKPFQTIEAVPIYEEIVISGAWWDFTDGLAPYRFRELLSTHPVKTAALLKEWAQGENIWKRRSAIISQLKRKQDTDLPLLYDCIEPSLESSEFFLRKAIGWALRDYAWTDMAEVERYVGLHRDRLSKLSVREALKHSPAKA